jgi:dTDP-4-amino-4,6-dideoxygalactose transaminase
MTSAVRPGGPGSHLLGEEEKKAALEVLESGHLFRYGDPAAGFLAKTWEFEEQAARYLGARHAVAVNSGTSALLVALEALGIGPGDEVIVPGYTFVASIGAIVHARAVPVLAEIDESLNLDPADVARKVTPRTKAVMLVHMLGSPGRIEEILAIVRHRGLRLIEDCAQAFGATYRGRCVGTWGDVGTHSFNVFKIITAGDGGMVTTDDPALYARAFAIHDQGHLPLRRGVEQGNRALIGLDLRMTELAAAVLLAQLAKMDDIKRRLKERKRRFKDGIRDLPGIAFRHLPDPEGDLASILTVLLPGEAAARCLARELGTRVIADSGWHVYNNMEHILGRKTVSAVGCPFTCPHYQGPPAEYRKGMLPRTDAVLARAVNVGIGIADAGLGAGFGVTVASSFEEVDRKIEQFRRAYAKCAAQ